MQKLMSYMRSACEKYNMIENGDKIALGVSGGKDSLAMLYAMSELRRFYPKKFSLTAITIDPCFNGKSGNFSQIFDLCQKLDVPYIIKETELAKIIFEDRKEKNPCSLCARMRRGILHDETKAAGCNKIALGHHMDDAAETFFMNLLRGGRLGCFSPVSYLSKKNITMIRPMIFAHEKDIIRVALKNKLPVVTSACPADGNTDRQEVKELINHLSHDYGALTQKVIGALIKADIDGWMPK